MFKMIEFRVVYIPVLSDAIADQSQTPGVRETQVESVGPRRTRTAPRYLRDYCVLSE